MKIGAFGIIIYSFLIVLYQVEWFVIGKPYPTPCTSASGQASDGTDGRKTSSSPMVYGVGMLSFLTFCQAD